MHIPNTISSAAKRALISLPEPIDKLPTTQLNNPKEWARYWVNIETTLRQEIKRARIVTPMRTMVTKYGGIECLENIPENCENDRRIIIYMHGGAYTFGNTECSLPLTLPLAHTTKIKLISINYTTAPQADWRQIFDECTSVIKALLLDGVNTSNLILAGDSAGGALAAGLCLKMRDEDLGLPGAIVLMSPWSDITETGDTYHTLREHDPSYYYDLHLKSCADAYAKTEDQHHPYVSPVYGDYSLGYSPTIITGGTKEIFLSNFVRLYQAIDQVDVEVKLDLYEGLWHVFQHSAPSLPETKISLKKISQFINRHVCG